MLMLEVVERDKPGGRTLYVMSSGSLPGDPWDRICRGSSGSVTIQRPLSPSQQNCLTSVLRPLSDQEGRKTLSDMRRGDYRYLPDRGSRLDREDYCTS